MILACDTTFDVGIDQSHHTKALHYVTDRLDGMKT